MNQPTSQQRNQLTNCTVQNNNSAQLRHPPALKLDKNILNKQTSVEPLPRPLLC